MNMIDRETFKAIWEDRCKVIFRPEGEAGDGVLITTPNDGRWLDLRITHVQKIMPHTLACSIEVLDRITPDDGLYEWKVYAVRDEHGRRLPPGQAF